tara:strand:- start:300 stop:1067 length:768 start_codon:yes stop_codon:yes gene_type:complete
MAINYTYMHTNTAFSADALNLRFEPFIGTNTGLNALTLDELSLGAFRHNITPRLIHTAEASTDTLVAKADIADPQSDYFTTRRDRAFSSTSVTVGEIMTVDFGTLPVQLGMTDTDNVGAVLVLANLDLDRITQTVNGTSVGPGEDFNYTLVNIRVEDSNLTTLNLAHTYRVLSPRVTVRTSGGAPATFALSGDTNTNQDISIRTVITQADITGHLIDVAKVHLVVTGINPGDPHVQEVFFGKGNMTAIPLHAKVN